MNLKTQILYPLFAVSLVCSSPLAGGEKPKPQPPSASSLTTFGEVLDVNVVNVDVYATDKSGKRVSDLRKGDFEVLEDGKRVAISNFVPARLPAAASPEKPLGPEVSGVSGASAPAPEAPTAASDPWNLIVYVDNSNIRPSHRTRALDQVREFLARSLSPGDRVMLVSSDLVVKVWQPFTSDTAALDTGLKAIEKVAAHGPEIDLDRKTAFDTMMSIQEISLNDPDPVPCPLNILEPVRNFAGSRRSEVLRSLGALTLLVNSLSGVPGRKAVLHVSDGIPAVPGEELFQFLLELCGGGGTSGIGQQAQAPSQFAGGDKPKPIQSQQDRLNPLAIYDTRDWGPRAYQAASQAVPDAQAYSVAKELAALVAHANAHQVTLYTLQASGVSGTEASDPSFGPGERLLQFPSIGSIQRASLQESLQTLAEGTGGRAILNANDLRPELAGLREDFSTFYALGYSPGHNGDGKEHRIEVRVKRPGVRLRYRVSYRDKPVIEKAVDRTLAALLYGIEDNPLQVTVEIGEQVPGPAGSVAVPIRLRIPLHKLAILNRDESFEGSLRLLVTTRSADGHSSPLRQVAVPIKIPRKEVLSALGQSYLYTLTLQLPPGTHQVAVGVRDEIATTTSYLSRNVTVGTATASAKIGAQN
jgi:VWFA-related protein